MKMRQQAFTLIELMIAVTIGLLVVYTAMAGLRVASGALTASNRIALENSLLRVGFIEAMEEVDFWAQSDNPLDPDAGQPFRKPGAGGGMTFTAFSLTVDSTTNASFVDKGLSLSEPSGGGIGGWNQHPLARSPSNPRIWNRINYFEEHSPFHYWGTGFIYSNLDKSKSPHYWLAGQIKGVIDTMGFWGMIEYMPSNTLFGYHGAAPLGSNGNVAWTGTSTAFSENGKWFCPNDGGDNMLKGRYRNTNGSRYALPGPQVATTVNCRVFYNVGYQGRQWGFDETKVDKFLSVTGVKALDADKREIPELWPQVYYTVRRIIVRGQFVNSVVLTMRDPKTGNAFEVPFIATGTTLRGARQQRRPTANGGWVVDPYKEATLDYPALPYDQMSVK